MIVALLAITMNEIYIPDDLLIEYRYAEFDDSKRTDVTRNCR